MSRTAMGAPIGIGRLRTAWNAAHEPVPGVSAWTRRLAYAVPLVVLPSSLWRLPAMFDSGIGVGERLYVPLLSVVSELLAFTAIGLVARWGEVFPRWLPRLRGRRVPVRLAVVPAVMGAMVLTVMFSLVTPITTVMGKTIRGDELPPDAPGQGTGIASVWFYSCYAPLVLWGPLLAVLTAAYWRRRRRADGVSAAAR
ncbi:hypothetical protein ACZ90_28310 [Streptomyces albus subsp. albus]|nr:hypothetical protein ACZ90_28310 [Streptomyces albus subsp. albus]